MLFIPASEHLPVHQAGLLQLLPQPCEIPTLEEDANWLHRCNHRDAGDVVMCQTKLSEKDYRTCIEAIGYVMNEVQKLQEEFPALPLTDADVFTGASQKDVEDLILRLSNNAEIAWLREQRSEKK